MKTKREIAEVLRIVKPSTKGFFPCPLKESVTMKGEPYNGNPDPEDAARILEWPAEMCDEIAKAFDRGGWSPREVERPVEYVGRFERAVDAGLRMCR